MNPCFIFELFAVLYDWLMTSFCLQKAKKEYKIYYISSGKSTQKRFLQSKFFSKHRIISWDNFYYLFHVKWSVSFNNNLSKIRYTYISIYKACDLQTKWPYHSTVPIICANKNFCFRSPLISFISRTRGSLDLLHSLVSLKWNSDNTARVNK